MSHLVSVVIPNYNNEKYLRECLDSVLSQNHSNLDIIVVDDASTDSSINILHGYNKDNSNIRIIQNKNNLGVSASRHMAIMQSRGVYITSLDSDDYYLCDDKIGSELKLLESYAGQDHMQVIAYSGISCVGDGRIRKAMPSKIIEGDIFERVITRDCMIPRDYLFTKKQYIDAGGFDKNIPMYEDWDLKIRLARHNEFFYTGKEGVVYRQHGDGLSTADRDKHVKWMSYVFNKNSGLIEKSRYKLIHNLFANNCIDPLILVDSSLVRRALFYLERLINKYRRIVLYK